MIMPPRAALARLVYSGDVDGRGIDRANSRIAARVLVESPDVAVGSPYLACAIGDEDALRAATRADPAWVNRPGGPLRLPPLVSITHSSLCQVQPFFQRLHRCARCLLWPAPIETSGLGCVGRRLVSARTMINLCRRLYQRGRKE